jgi:hypothetical protein
MSIMYSSSMPELVATHQRELMDAAKDRAIAAEARSARKAERRAKRAARRSRSAADSPAPAGARGVGAQSPATAV